MEDSCLCVVCVYLCAWGRRCFYAPTFKMKFILHKIESQTLRSSLSPVIFKITPSLRGNGCVQEITREKCLCSVFLNWRSNFEIEEKRCHTMAFSFMTCKKLTPAILVLVCISDLRYIHLPLVTFLTLHVGPFTYYVENDFIRLHLTVFLF